MYNFFNFRNFMIHIWGIRSERLYLSWLNYLSDQSPSLLAFKFDLGNDSRGMMAMLGICSFVYSFCRNLYCLKKSTLFCQNYCSSHEYLRIPQQHMCRGIPSLKPSHPIFFFRVCMFSPMTIYKSPQNCFNI
jgi:hypothetical protein